MKNKSMTATERETLEKLGTVVVKLDDKKKERLLGFAEGMAFLMEEKRDEHGAAV